MGRHLQRRGCTPRGASSRDPGYDAFVAEPSRRVRWSGALLAALAALVIAMGATSPRWWSGSRGVVEWGVGVGGVELCSPASCVSRGLDGLGTEAWTRLGAVAFAIGWVAILFLAAAVCGAIAAPGSRWSLRLGRAAAALSLFTLVVGSGFAWTYPGFDGLGAGWAMFAYLGGAVLGVGSAGMLIGGGDAPRAP